MCWENISSEATSVFTEHLISSVRLDFCFCYVSSGQFSISPSTQLFCMAMVWTYWALIIMLFFCVNCDSLSSTLSSAAFTVVSSVSLIAVWLRQWTLSYCALIVVIAMPSFMWNIRLVPPFGASDRTFIYPIHCLDLTLPEFWFTYTLFLQISPWESLRVTNNTWIPSIQCK